MDSSGACVAGDLNCLSSHLENKGLEVRGADAKRRVNRESRSSERYLISDSLCVCDTRAKGSTCNPGQEKTGSELDSVLPARL
jgi:hypothetical protein